MSIDTAINLDYIIPQLRMALWDIDDTKYRYTDGWLRVALVTSVKVLQRWWKNRYLVDVDNNVSRNTDSGYSYSLDEPEVLETSDERPVVLMASILVKSGVLENSSWTIATWRDAEYYVSNIESGKAKEASIKRDWDELLGIMKPPAKRLSAGTRITFDGIGADETT